MTMVKLSKLIGLSGLVLSALTARATSIQDIADDLANVSLEPVTRIVKKPTPPSVKRTTKAGDVVDKSPVRVPVARNLISDDVSASVDSQISALRSCLSTLKGDSRFRSSAENEALLDSYVQVQTHRLDKIDENKSSDSAVEKRRLVYAHWIVSHKLSECEDLLDGPSKPRYIFMVGQQAKNDGKIGQKSGLRGYKSR